MEQRYRIVASRGFEKDIRRIRKRSPNTLEALKGAVALLREDPFNRRGSVNISKLVDIPARQGQFRLRLGDWRLWYDVVGYDVVLHSMRPRRESYRP
jgi:mRNA-degrading endonuclease RelE of RelBE toxin-antitoxin system